MAERATNSYRRLFEIRLLHHYWLDEGATLFDLISDPTKKARRLSGYDVRTLLTLTPTATTAKDLRGLGCLYQNTSLGGVVAVPQDTVIPTDTVFEFVVTMRDAAFYNYTALTLQPQKVHELYSKPGDEIYHYKENVPVLSNYTGALRTLSGATTLFLAQEYPALSGQEPVESLALSGTKLVQLTADKTTAGQQELTDKAETWPVFVHQGDVPALTPPVGLAGVPTHGIGLTAGIPDNLIMLLRLAAQAGAGKESFSFARDNGQAKEPPPIYQVRFKNRSTFWQYLNSKTREEISLTGPFPLTYFGKIGDQQKPSAGLVKVKKDSGNIPRLVSEIFV